MSKVPPWIIKNVAALALLCGFGFGGYTLDQSIKDEAQQKTHATEYVQAVAHDTDTSTAVKIAMVVGSYYESSGKHIGTPYIDKLGKGQPLTVCNGITGKGVIAGKWYSPTECFRLEKGRYQQAEREAAKLLTYWASYDDFAKATFIDFVHNKGSSALSTSTMRRKANLGNLAGACRENPRWNKGTVKGVSTVLPGLQLRGEANAEICSLWWAQSLLPAHPATNPPNPKGIP